MRHIVLDAALVVAAVASVGRAQSDRLWEIRPVVGISIPTGTQRDLFKDAFFTGGEAALRIVPTVDVVTSVVWQAADTKYRVATTTASVWVFDVGVEKEFRDTSAHRAGFAPFLGAGVGGRAYDFDSSELVSRTCYAGYAAAGVAYEWHGSAARASLRDNVFCYESPVPGLASQTRNEIALSIGLGVRF